MLIAFLCQVGCSHHRTRLWSTLCLSPPGSACLFAESLARTIGQGLGPRFAFLHQPQRFSSPSRGLASQGKAWVHSWPLSSKRSVSPCKVAGSHHRTRLGSTLCHYPPGSACLHADSRKRTSGQGLGPRLAFLLQAQRFSLPIPWLALQDKA